MLSLAATVTYLHILLTKSRCEQLNYTIREKAVNWLFLHVLDTLGPKLSILLVQYILKLKIIFIQP